MTTVRTRCAEIKELEGFRIVVRKNGKRVNKDTHGLIKKWPYENATKGARTTKQFQEKFSKANPGYTCDVLRKNGDVAHGGTLLKNIREH